MRSGARGAGRWWRRGGVGRGEGRGGGGGGGGFGVGQAGGDVQQSGVQVVEGVEAGRTRSRRDGWRGGGGAARRRREGREMSEGRGGGV